jgi:hypothetical protein
VSAAPRPRLPQCAERGGGRRDAEVTPR